MAWAQRSRTTFGEWARYALEKAGAGKPER
jgi:hypothetical protein